MDEITREAGIIQRELDDHSSSEGEELPQAPVESGASEDEDENENAATNTVDSARPAPTDCTSSPIPGSDLAASAASSSSITSPPVYSSAPQHASASSATPNSPVAPNLPIQTTPETTVNPPGHNYATRPRGTRRPRINDDCLCGNPVTEAERSDKTVAVKCTERG